jgi:acyl-CoA thioesterase FadM
MFALIPRYSSQSEKARSKGVHAHPGGLVEELLIEHRERLVQELLRAGPAGGGRGGGGEDHEGVGVGLLRVVDGAAVGHRGEPAAVLVVVEDAAQRGDAVVGEAAEVGPAQQVAEREGVGHPAGDPQLGGAGEVRGAGLVQPGEAAVLPHRLGAEDEQLVGLVRQPGAVRGAVEPGHVRGGGRRGRSGRGVLAQLEAARGLLGLGGGGAGLGDHQHLAVVLQLLDRLADVGEGAVPAVLRGDVVVHPREPALGQLLEARDVDRAIGEPVRELGHVAVQEHAVGADAVARQRRLARLRAVLLHIGEALRLRLGEGHAAVELLEQPGDGVHVHHEGIHALQRLGRGLDHDVDAVPEDVQIGVGHEHGDLDQRIALLVESGHLAVDPDDAVVDGTSGAGGHRTTVAWRPSSGAAAEQVVSSLACAGEDPGKLPCSHLVSTTSRRDPGEGTAMNMYLRLLLFLLRVRAKSPLDIWDTSHASFRVNPADLDVQRHMNNGRYLSIMDLGRMDLMLRSGFWKKVTGAGWYPVVAGQTITYRRSLTLGQRFDLATRVIGYDERWIYMEQVFRRGDTVIADAIVRARFLRTSGGSVDVDEVLALTGPAPEDLVLPDWVAEWNRESSAHSRGLGETGRGR